MIAPWKAIRLASQLMPFAFFPEQQHWQASLGPSSAQGIEPRN